MKLPEWLQEKLRTLLVAAVVGVFGFFGAKIYYAIAGPLLSQVLPAMPNTVLLSLCSILLLTVALLVWWVIYLHHLQKHTVDDFETRFGEFDQRLGLWKHGTQYLCPRCKGRRVVSPLKKDEKGWSCPVCEWFYYNPDYKERPSAR